MKYTQKFDDYKIIVDFDYDSTILHVINMKENNIELKIVNSVVKLCCGFSTDTSKAFELTNLYQEALSIANTKSLTPELLTELGYEKEI